MFRRLWPAMFWLLIWQAAAMWLGQDILLVSPVRVAGRLFALCGTALFWQSIWFSLLRIGAGFLLAVVAGVALASLASVSRALALLFGPLIAAVKATPVASFVILSLVWIPSKNLSVFISFLMVMPVIYANVYTGIERTDAKLLEMARVFRVPLWRRVRTIYASQALPYFRAGCSLGLGLCWKSGIAAEVIGMPRGSIGERLYQAKIYLDTPDLFAWTLVIILVSLLFEKLFLAALDALVRALERR